MSRSDVTLISTTGEVTMNAHAKHRSLASLQMSRNLFLSLVLVLACALMGYAEDVDSMAEYQPDRIIIPGGLGGDIRIAPYTIVPSHYGYGILEQSLRDNEQCAKIKFWVDSPYIAASVQKLNVVSFSNHSWLRQRQLDGCGNSIGPFYRKEIIPICGALYRVANIQPSDEGAYVALDKLAKSEWPAGISLDPFAYAITPGSAIGMRNVCRTAPIAVTYDSSAKHFTLKLSSDTLQLYHPERPQFETVDLVVDSLITFQIMVGNEPVSFRVVSIVPPNPDKHIPGWVEVRRIWPRVTPFGTVEK